MKKIDLKNKTQTDLNRLLVEKRESLRLFRFGTTGAKSKNVKEGSVIKKDIARIMTAMNAMRTAKN